jgi:pyridoxamine 5'-phosphate oxidase
VVPFNHTSFSFLSIVAGFAFSHHHSVMTSLQDVRSQLKNADLNRANMPNDPFSQFEQWLQEAHEAKLPHPNAMSIATVSADGLVSSRMVMLRYFEQRGFVFFTGLETQKVRDISENENISLLFPWLMLERQVRIAGTAVSIPTSESLKFFASRTRESQMGAWLTQSSDVISSRTVFKQKWIELKQKFGEGQVPLPSAWGGFRVIPRRIEFWQGHVDGLHDRFAYTRQKEADWGLERLLP